MPIRQDVLTGELPVTHNISMLALIYVGELRAIAAQLGYASSCVRRLKLLPRLSIDESFHAYSRTALS